MPVTPPKRDNQAEMTTQSILNAVFERLGLLDGYLKVGIFGKDSGIKKLIPGRTVVPNAGTEANLPDEPCAYVACQGLYTNTNRVVVGGTGVTSSDPKGIELDKGDTAVMPIDNANKVFINAVTDGDGVGYIIFTA